MQIFAGDFTDLFMYLLTQEYFGEKIFFCNSRVKLKAAAERVCSFWHLIIYWSLAWIYSHDLWLFVFSFKSKFESKFMTLKLKAICWIFPNIFIFCAKWHRIITLSFHKIISSAYIWQYIKFVLLHLEAGVWPACMCH